MELSFSKKISFYFFLALPAGIPVFFLHDTCIPSFSKGFWGICVGHGWSIYFERPYLWVGYQGYANKVMWVSIDGGIHCGT